jgi:hypothetical protein
MKRSSAGLILRLSLTLFCLAVFFKLSAFASISLSTEEVARLVAESPGASEYPEAGALILYHDKRLVISPENDQTLQEHLLVKILKDRGRRFGDQKRNFDAKSDSVEVLVARTWLADGSIVPVEPKAINVITPPELVGAAVYADIKQKVISFGQIAPGVVIELLTRSISRADSVSPLNLYPYWDIEIFRSDEPILHKRYVLQIPENFPPPLVFTGGALEQAGEESLSAEEATREGFSFYRWEMRDVPMIHSIPYMPPARSFAPVLILSNVETWEKLGSWLGKTFFQAAEPDETIRAKVAELTSECRTAADSVRSIALFVTTEVRNISLSLGLTGYKPTSAAKIFQNMYGHDLDKAVLLSAMLNAAGIENYPAYCRSDQVDLLELSVPSAAQFSRVAIFVPGSFTDSTFANTLFGQVDRQGLWLMPFAQYNRYGYFNRGQGNRALVILPSGGTLYTTTEFPPEKSLSMSTGELALEDNGDIQGRFETLADGLFDAEARLSLKDLTPRELEQYFQQATNAIGEGAIKRSHSISDMRDLETPARVELQFAAPEVGVVQGDMMILRIPSVPFPCAGIPYFPNLEEREFDFVADGPFLLASDMVIELPAGWQIAYQPETVTLESPFGRWKIECIPGDGRITYSRRLSIGSRQVSTENYPGFKDFCESFTLPKHSILLLEKNGSAR